jgi:hypothetical protein
MESLLLGALSYYGASDQSQNSDKIETYKKLNMYDSNMESKMNIIEQNQAKKQPEFFNQFDNLSFDNISKPTAENQSYFTNSGFNNFLQRDLDFKNGYSEFQNNDMHYDVVTKENFVHNNMTPSTSKRDTFTKLTGNSRKYENLSGNDQYWNHKKEIEPFFAPMQKLTNPHGLPVVAGDLAGRYNPSNKNNHGNLPFQTDLKIVRGIEGGVQKGPYAVYRINPRSIDELRSEINKKESFLSKPLETIKKGEYRGMDFNITKYKIPSYRENNTNDFVSNKASFNAMKKTGEFVHVDSQRGEGDHFHSGGPINSSMGNFISQDSIQFTDAKKENYLNDFTHAINAVNTRPVFQNQESYVSYENERDSTNQELRASGAALPSKSAYHIDRTHKANTTLKELNIEGDRHLGFTGPSESKTYMFSKDSILQTTNRNTTSHNIVSNAKPTYSNPNLQLTDEAKKTIRETTEQQKYIGNAKPTYSNPNLQLTDEARKTIRETTEQQKYIGNSKPTYSNPNLQLTDTAKKTIRETTEQQKYIGNSKPTYGNPNLQLTDEAKKTIRETTEQQKYIGNAKPTYSNPNLQLTDEARKTIRETTEQQNYIGNSKPTYSNPNLQLTDTAKKTIRETTEQQKYIGNSKPTYSNPNLQLTDTAKKTIRETTEQQKYIGNSKPTHSNPSVYHTDTARKTIKETTEDRNFIGNAKPTHSNPGVHYTDTARQTIRETTEDRNYIGNSKPTYSNPSVYYTDTAKQTIKETTENSNYIGNSKPTMTTSYVQYTDVAKKTTKETTESSNYIGNSKPTYGNPYMRNNDNAKQTIKETVMHNLITNATSDYKNPYTPLNDTARATIKETTENNNHIGIAGGDNKESYALNEDIAKTTIRQTTLDSTPNMNPISNIPDSYINNNDLAKVTVKETTLSSVPFGRFADTNQSNYCKDSNDRARVTIKETTILSEHTGTLGSQISAIRSEQAERNMVIDDKREISSMINYTPNAKSDQIRGNINEDSVRFNDKKMVYGYISAPGRSLNYTVTPFDNIYCNKKTDLNGNNFYKIDPIFITTLGKNPLVNDLMHQKNF